MSSMIGYTPKLVLGRADAQGGEMNILLIPVILLALFFIGAGAFGYWAFSERQDYKNNAEQKIAVAVKVAKQAQNAEDTKLHAEADKLPLKPYLGPEQFGSLHVMYPKTWSGYVVDSGSGGAPLDGYFQPGVVPGTQDEASIYALRVSVVGQSYSTVVKQFSNSVSTKKLTATAYALPKVPNVVGIRYDGEIKQGKKITGNMVVLPMRDKTLEIWAESPIYYPDFNEHILPNFSFSP